MVGNENLYLLIVLYAAASFLSPLLAEEQNSSFRDCAKCPEMVVLPPGSFTMGVEGETAREFQKPARLVTLQSAIAVGMYEITFDEWNACIADGGCTHLPADEGWGKGKRPVIHISWLDAVEYTQWLSKRTGRRYRLLSEAEWEYAAKGGTVTPYSFEGSDADLCEYGNHAALETPYEWRSELCDDGYGELTSPVGSYDPNPFGLYDMHGNVWEWVQDCWFENYVNAPASTEPREYEQCENRNMRGGSWRNRAINLRSAWRNYDKLDSRFYNLGFRVARELD